MVDSLTNKHVVVMGFARQGMALARWLPKVGARVTVTDMRPFERFGDSLQPYQDAGVEFVLGDHPLRLLDDADLLCISGGVSPDVPLAREAVRRGIPLSNDAQVFLERSPAPIIGITGSAGKTTTTTLVGLMCRRTDRTTYVGGNIGDVLLDVLPNLDATDTVVMELSSFQLELATTSPPLAAILNVTPNHLDRHGTMEAYTAAKARIIEFQNTDGIAVLGRDDAGSAALAGLVRGRTVWFSATQQVADGAYLAGDELVVCGAASPDGGIHPVVRVADIRLRGAHNVLNVLAACAIAGAAGVPPTAMREAILEFRGVEHRLEIVRELDGVTWVNDSIATAPERVLAALRSYSEPMVLLLGGRDKKLPWDELAAYAAKQARAVVTFGEYGPAIADAVQAAVPACQDGRLHADHVRTAGTLDDAVALAAEEAQSGDVVLLSPGCTSYDAYLDFAERGTHFRELVARL